MSKTQINQAALINGLIARLNDPVYYRPEHHVGSEDFENTFTYAYRKLLVEHYGHGQSPRREC